MFVAVFQGVVTAAASLITSLAQKSPDEFKTSVSLAVARLSRVGVCPKHTHLHIHTYIHAYMHYTSAYSGDL